MNAITTSGRTSRDVSNGGTPERDMSRRQAGLVAAALLLAHLATLTTAALAF
ncbi:MAG: hypothetical protein NTZ21_17635 [Actinobacteria bacterium]|nr:hypothetical protein [Actinomycetota bacterium]